jgi:hypothetical protein
MKSISAISESERNAADYHQQEETEPQPLTPLSDEDAITMHVRTLLAVENNDPATVTKSMGLLRVFLSSSSKTIHTSKNTRHHHYHDNANSSIDQNRKMALRRGAHVAVVYAMRRNLRNWPIQNDGLGIFVSLCRCKLDSSASSSVTKHDIIAVGGLDCCLDAMREHFDVHHVQAIGCCLLANFWCCRNSSCHSLDMQKKAAIDKQGGLSAVIRAMEHHEFDVQVQYRACRALFVLLRKDESCSTTTTIARAVVDVGSIHLVVAAMNNHPDDATIQICACDFLTALAKKKKGGNNHENDDGDGDYTGDDDVDHVADDDHCFYRNLILDAKALGAIVEARRFHKDNVQVKLATRNALNAIM